MQQIHVRRQETMLITNIIFKIVPLAAQTATAGLRRLAQLTMFGGRQSNHAATAAANNVECLNRLSPIAKEAAKKSAGSMSENGLTRIGAAGYARQGNAKPAVREPRRVAEGSRSHSRRNHAFSMFEMKCG
jgi:hypothetical protein